MELMENMTPMLLGHMEQEEFYVYQQNKLSTLFLAIFKRE